MDDATDPHGSAPDAVEATGLDPDAVDRLLSRIEESLRLLDDPESDPSAVVGWLDAAS